MTFRAIVRELGMRGRDFAGVEKSFAAIITEEKNCEQSAKESDQTNDESRPSPRMKPAVISEIAFVALGDLLLRASGFRHRFSN